MLMLAQKPLQAASPPAPVATTQTLPASDDGRITRLPRPDSASTDLVHRLPPTTQQPIEIIPAPSTGAPQPQSLPSPTEGTDGRGLLSSDIIERLQRVEREIIETKRQLDNPTLNTTIPSPAAPPYPWVRLIGEMQTDLAQFSQSELNKQTVGDAQNGIDFRRARLAAVGQVSDFNDYRLEMEFAEPGRPLFLDVYMSQYMLPVLNNIRIGHFFEPFCMSRIIDNRFDIFMERPLLTVFAPSRRTGFMTFGVRDDLSATWAASVYSSSDNFFGGGNLTDVGGWAGAGRVTWVPYYDEASGGRHYLHLGAAYSFSGVTNHQLQFATTPELQLIDNNNFEPIFLNTGLISATQYQLLGSELIWTAGPWSLQSEYVCVPINTIGGPTATLQGAYVMGSYFLTGEHRPYDRTQGNMVRVVPFEDFFRFRGPRHVSGGRGAWQIAARWSYLNFNGGDIRAGVLNDVTVGVNWYWNPFTRVYFNYVHAMLDDVALGASQADAFGLRFQLDF